MQPELAHQPQRCLRLQKAQGRSCQSSRLIQACRDLRSIGHKIFRGALPIVVWGNGACVALGGMYRGFLSEIASYGYLVISLGKFGPEDVATMTAAPPSGARAGYRAPDGQPGPPPDFKPATTWNQMIEAIDWATKQNANPQSRFAGKLDTRQSRSDGALMRRLFRRKGHRLTRA